MSNSKIIDYMKSHGENWRSDFEKEYPDITIKEDYPFLLFKYSIKSNFRDPIVQEARGIIINQETQKVVCFPFRKFGEYGESYADKIDWSSARVEEKIDGSLIKLWYDNDVQHNWRWSTNNMINADGAYTIDEDKTYLDVIKRCHEYEAINFEELDKKSTYLFELVSPLNEVIVKYSEYRLYHIGTRDTETGKEYLTDIDGVRKPGEFYPDDISLSGCLLLLDKIRNNSDFDSVGRLTSVKYEGFVVVDKNFNRIKVKSPEYMLLHGLKSKVISDDTRDYICGSLWSGLIDVGSICSQYPNLAHIVKFYDYKVTEFKYSVSNFLKKTARIIKESKDRKEIALQIKDSKYKHFGFQFVDHSEFDADYFLGSDWDKRWLKYIDEYKLEY